MFDLGMSEMAVLGAVALIVVGPKDLPKLARSIGQIYSKMRNLAGEFRGALDQIARESELEDLKKAADKARTFNPTKAAQDYVLKDTDKP
ncbi:MAG: Sec-independent protein translocase protein TatB [Pseudomonadota bacterium]